MSLKSKISPNLYLPLNKFFPEYFVMDHNISFNDIDENQTIELITKTGLEGKQLYDLFIEGGELDKYLGGSTTDLDKNPLSDIFLMLLGIFTSIIIYLFIIYQSSTPSFLGYIISSKRK